MRSIGVGPSCLSGRNLTTRELVKAIRFISTDPKVRENAQRISEQIRAEQGCEAALRTFHLQLPLENMRSDLEPKFVASVRIPRYNIKVSWPVAQVLLEAGKIAPNEVMPLVTKEWNLTNSDNDPTPLQLRIPEQELPYSSEEREQILSNFALIANFAQAD